MWNSNTVYCIEIKWLAKIGKEAKWPSILQAILISPVQMVWAAAVSITIIFNLSLKLCASIPTIRIFNTSARQRHASYWLDMDETM